MFRAFESRAQFREILLTPGVLPYTARLDVEQRFPQLIGLRESAGASFARRRAVVVGVGSVGRPIALHLARLGIDVLWLVDSGRYDDRANLLTQAILATDLGQSKAGSTGEACKNISPATRVFVYEGEFQDLDPATMAEADVAFLSTDNLVGEVDASYLFRLLGIHIVQASVHGQSLVAQVRFVENRCAENACLICAFGPEEYRHLNQSSIFRCSGIEPGDRPSEQISVMPTNSTSFLCSLAADFALTQWTRHVLNLGQPVGDTILQYCGYTHHVTQAKLNCNGKCKARHMILERVGLPKALSECTTSELAHFAGFDDHRLDSLSVTLGDLSYVKSAVCRCAEHSVERFLSSRGTLGICAVCNEQITPQPYYTFRPTPGSALSSRQDRPLKELGGQAAAWAVVHGNERGVLLRAKAGTNSSTDNDQEAHHEA